MSSLSGHEFLYANKFLFILGDNKFMMDVLIPQMDDKTREIVFKLIDWFPLVPLKLPKLLALKRFWVSICREMQYLETFESVVPQLILYEDPMWVVLVLISLMSFFLKRPEHSVSSGNQQQKNIKGAKLKIRTPNIGMRSPSFHSWIKIFLTLWGAR